MENLKIIVNDLETSIKKEEAIADVIVDLYDETGRWNIFKNNREF